MVHKLGHQNGQLLGCQCICPTPSPSMLQPQETGPCPLWNQRPKVMCVLVYIQGRRHGTDTGVRSVQGRYTLQFPCQYAFNSGLAFSPFGGPSCAMCPSQVALSMPPRYVQSIQMHCSAWNP